MKPPKLFVAFFLFFASMLVISGCDGSTADKPRGIGICCSPYRALWPGCDIDRIGLCKCRLCLSGGGGNEEAKYFEATLNGNLLTISTTEKLPQIDPREFIFDVDFPFDDEISQKLGYKSVIIKAGKYPISQMGTKSSATLKVEKM